MIELTSLKGDKFILNYNKILLVEQQADTIVKCTTGQVYRVQEDASDIVLKVVEFNRNIFGIKYAGPESKSGPI